MPSYLRQQKFPFGSLRKDPHWSTSGLVSLYLFSPSGKLIDYSPRGNNGTLVNNPTWFSSGMAFDGATQRVQVNPFRFPNGGGDLTFIIISTPGSTGESDQGRFLEFDGRFQIQFASVAGGIRIDRDTNDVTGAWRNLADFGLVGVRSHFAITHTGTDAPLAYINGVNQFIVTELTAPVGAYTSLDGGNFNIASNNAESRALDINMEYMAIYNRALNSSEIFELYVNPNLPLQQDFGWMGKAPVVAGATPKGPLTHPLYGSFAGPIAC